MVEELGVAAADLCPAGGKPQLCLGVTRRLVACRAAERRRTQAEARAPRNGLGVQVLSVRWLNISLKIFDLSGRFSKASMTFSQSALWTERGFSVRTLRPAPIAAMAIVVW